jgi:hypothetical protein
LGGFGDLGPAGRRWEGHDGNYLYKGIDRERKGIFCKSYFLENLGEMSSYLR